MIPHLSFELVTAGNKFTDKYEITKISKSLLERFHFAFFIIFFHKIFGLVWTVKFIQMILLIIIWSNHTYIERWEMSDEPSLGEHLRSCRIFAQSKVSYQNDRPRALPAMAQGTQLKNYTYLYWYEIQSSLTDTWLYALSTALNVLK